MTEAPTTLDRLRALVAEVIAANPFERDGFEWAARPQQFYVQELGVSVETVRRIIAKPPFVRQRTVIGDRVVTLLREGTPGPVTFKHAQNILTKIWRTKTGRLPASYGHMAGLVQHWGIEHSPAILTTVLNNWPGFMTGAKLHIAEHGGTEKYFKYPASSVVLCFHFIGLELHVMEHQEKHGGKKTAALGLKYPEPIKNDSAGESAPRP